MNVVFLMGGARQELGKEQYPLYLTEMPSGTVLERQVEYVNKINPLKLIFCLNESEIKQFHVDAAIRQINSDATIISLKSTTKGSICTALLALEHIDSNEELILMAIDDFVEEYSTHIVDFFRSKTADAGVVSFDSIHPRYSFVKLDSNNEPIEFAEKTPISKNALVSFYYFKQGKDFVECAKDVIRKDTAINGNFFISQTFNEMILRQKKISVYKINNDKFHPLKTEHQMMEYMHEVQERRSSK